MSQRLRRRLLDRIRDAGPITFAEFMEAALYDPADGFYAGLPVGADEHFVTSPHVSPAFGALVARQLGEVWELLGRPRPFRVVELGAGDGTLARRVLTEAAGVPELARALDYSAVEPSPAARRALAEVGVTAHATLSDAREVECVLANEVLDNIPFHRLRERDGRVMEVLVGADGDRLIEVESEPCVEAAPAPSRPLSPGEERAVSPATLDLVGQVAKVLPRGYAFFFDYGFEPGEAPGDVHGYRQHRVAADILADPGSRDITAAVDLEVVAAEARRLRLTVWGPVSQREALLALGMRVWLQGVRRRQREAEERGDHRGAARLYAERSRASILIDEGKLGGLRLLVLGTDGLPAPAAVLGDRESDC